MGNNPKMEALAAGLRALFDKYPAIRDYSSMVEHPPEHWRAVALSRCEEDDNRTGDDVYSLASYTGVPNEELRAVIFLICGKGTDID